MTEIEKAQSMPPSPPGPDADLYAVLGIARDASRAEVVKGYRRESKRWHPDRNPGCDQAKVMYERVDTAYRVLSDPDRRREYDRTGAYTTTGTVGREQYVVKVVTQLVIDLVTAITCQGGDVRKEPMIGLLKKNVEKRVVGLRKTLADLRKTVEALKHAEGRFTVEGGEENVVAATIKYQITQMLSQAAGVEVEIELMADAQTFIDKYRYKMDPADPRSFGMFSYGAATTTIHWERP